MKKIMMILSLLLLCACGKPIETFEETIDLEKIVDKQWVFEDMLCTQYFTLKSDQQISYYEACGNPVNNFDCYETYEIKSNQIIFHGEDIEDLTYEILRYDDQSLLMKTEDGIKQFTFECEIPLLSDYSDYFQGYSAYVSLLKLEDKEIKCGPSFYDGDVKEHREMTYMVALSEDVKFYELYIETIHSEEEVTTSHSYQELTSEDAELLLDSTLGGGFIWYNDNLEIEKIVFYGEIEIW